MHLGHRVTTVVRRIVQETDRIRLYELADPDGWDLPPFTAGAHIDVHLPNGAVRQYSLCGDPAESNCYRIAVQREAEGRGGSACLHDRVREGDILSVSLPRNHFPLAPEADRHILVAGGIGITPFLSMIPVLARSGTPFELHVCARTPEALPFGDHLRSLAASGTAQLHFSRGAGCRRLDVEGLLSGRAPGDHVYCCGPASLLDAVKGATESWHADRVHYEHFGANQAPATADVAYTVRLARSGETVVVEKGRTMLEALRAGGVEIESSCEGGVCRSCLTRYLDGVPVHRDLVLKADERATHLTPCVSGCVGDTIVLDL